MPRPSPPAPPSASPLAEAAELELTAAGPASCIRNLLGADVDLAGLGAELGQPLRAHPCARLIILTSPCSIMLAPTLAITLARSPLRSFLRSHLCDGSITKGSGEHYFVFFCEVRSANEERVITPKAVCGNTCLVLTRILAPHQCRVRSMPMSSRAKLRHAQAPLGSTEPLYVPIWA